MLESLKCEVIVVVWLSAYPSKCRGDFMLCLASSERLYLVERGVCVLPVVFTQILSGGCLCGKSCVDELVENFLCEGGDVKLCDRTSKQISVFAFDPLSLTLSLLYCALHHFILLIHILYAWLVCVCLTCV